MYKILIVEDTLEIREEIADILMMEGYNVLQAENGRVGYEKALNENPDLIISDILMPELNGIEMFKKLKKEARTDSIPLIFLSAKAEKNDIRAGMNLGAEDYLSKPVNIDDLVNAVKIKIKKQNFVKEKINEKTIELANILQNQKNELDNYSHLISHGLKSSLRNVSDLLAWTQEELEDNAEQDSSFNIQLMGEKIEKMELLLVKLEQYNNITPESFKNGTININTIAERVIKEINNPPNVAIQINNELPSVLADEFMIEQVFKILISNAVKYNNKKNGVIEIDYKNTNSDYIFSVKDNGIGIDAKYHKKIFKIFRSLESSKTSTGIGLSMVKKIICNYKGKVWVNSIPNKETIFYFNLPKNK